MKRIIFLLLCVMLVFAMPLVAYAEETPAETESAQTENVPSTEENAAEGEISVPEQTVTESIVAYVQEHFEEISVIGTLAATIFYEVRKHRKLNGSIGTLNNNAVAIAQNSSTAIDAALGKVNGIAEIVQGYKDEIALLLAEIRKSAEEKQSLESMLAQVDAHLKNSKLANMEFANELADLLCLANIPNSKKEELFSRHRAAVASIEAEEVKADDGNES